VGGFRVIEMWLEQACHAREIFLCGGQTLGAELVRRAFDDAARANIFLEESGVTLVRQRAHIRLYDFNSKQ
jgi:stage V sporulation protein SpoVS